MTDLATPSAGAAPVEAFRGRGRDRWADQLFRGTATGAGLVVVAVVCLVGAFLVVRAVPALAQNHANFLTSRVFEVDGGTLRFGIADLLWTTLVSSALALLIAVPLAVGVSLFLTQYAPRRLAGPAAALIDLLAAVPSIVYGLWAVKVLMPYVRDDVQGPLSGALGWVPLFKDVGISSGTVLLVSIVLAIMILPIVTALSREVFARTPRAHREAALALGATRWETVRTTVLPFGRGGVVAASMLGLGRALGETVAVMIVLSTLAPGAAWSFSLLNGGETFASRIANNAAEFDSPSKTGAFVAAGLVLFVLTFVVNAVARIVVERQAKRGMA
jgi:phosphate transport system permease protein